MAKEAAKTESPQAEVKAAPAATPLVKRPKSAINSPFTKNATKVFKVHNLGKTSARVECRVNAVDESEAIRMAKLEYPHTQNDSFRAEQIT